MATVEIAPAEGVALRRHLPDGRAIDVVPITFGRARVAIGRPASGLYDDLW